MEMNKGDKGKSVSVNLDWTPIVERLMEQKGDKWMVVEETLWYDISSPYPMLREKIDISIHKDKDECFRAVTDWILENSETL